MGTLYIVSTPIGNMDDITIRAIKTLGSVDIIACEDTRHTGLLLSELKSRYPDLVSASNKPKLISHNEHNEEQRAPELVQMLLGGQSIALVSDAGTPLISDPGYRLVQECIKRDIEVVSIPGPTAFIAALSISGLPTNNIWFGGYLQKKAIRRKKLLKSTVQRFESLDRTTIVFYEAPHRLRESLRDIHAVCGDIDVVIARELTKIHEEVWRGKVSEAIKHFQNPKGEFVILLKLSSDT